MSELKPCPFCGSTDVAANSYIIEASVHCFDCSAVIVRKHPKYGDGGLVAAITAWNTRATDALLREAAEALEEIAVRDSLPTPSFGGVKPGQYAYINRAGPLAEIACATLAKMKAHLKGEQQ